MASTQTILSKIKASVKAKEPDAMIILFGSFARGDNHPESDLDVLILLDKEQINWEYGKKIRYDLYDIEFETGQMISPMVKSKKDWYNKYKATPFFASVNTEGIVL